MYAYTNCHAGGREFESRPDRSYKAASSQGASGFFIVFLKNKLSQIPLLAVTYQWVMRFFNGLAYRKSLFQCPLNFNGALCWNY